MIDYDAELQLHNEQFRAALGIRAADRVLDIGCGTGQTTREAARVASGGDVLGVDINEGMIARARELATREGLPNVLFEVGDAQAHPFRSGAFDVAISRFGTMFFSDPDRAFRNIARAVRGGGRLVMMVWRAHDRNEWAVAIDHALGVEERGLTTCPECAFVDNRNAADHHDIITVIPARVVLIELSTSAKAVASSISSHRIAWRLHSRSIMPVEPAPDPAGRWSLGAGPLPDCAKGPDRNKLTILAADASRLAALLLAYIGPLCALVAPCQPGASTPRMANLFLSGS